jgi:hypothetical protein
LDNHNIEPQEERAAPTSETEVATSSEVRLPFEPPRLLWSEPFQPVAYGMACGKQAGQQNICNSFPNFS